MQSVPQLGGRVTDQTLTLDPPQKQTLESELAALERRKGSQIAVLIVHTTQPEDIAQYAIRAFDQWKLGRKGVDDGVLLIVAKDDRRMRIEVGRGLEGAIPDAATARILRDYVKPKFRDGDFYGGIHDATGALVKLIDGEALPSVDEPSKSNIRYNKDIVGNPLFIVFVLVLLSIVLRLLLFFLPTLIGGLVAGGASAASAWYWMQAMDWTTLPSFFTACISFLLGLILCPQPGGRYAGGSGVGSFDSGSGSSSSSSSDSGSSSSSSSDSFSGGGGESGGGGSSDSW
ncbi:YgcG family protein [Rudaea sp.]|uniref:TPM domain-containing protein n=1 Tax=Rudaea sp. TaxID=2136325 RepID=UPI002ED536B6